MENCAEKEKMFIHGNKLSKKLFVIIAAVAIVILGVSIFLFAAPSSDEETTIITESTLKEVLEISELSTVEYTYNAVASKQVEGKDETAYHVAYEGKVKAGIDFESINIAIDEGKKLVTITLPEIEIHQVEVAIESLDFIFVKAKYEHENVALEAYNLCAIDLKERVEKEELLKITARENAISSVEALFKPWIESVDDEYEVTVE